MGSVVWVFEQGGWVSYALAVVSIFLWTAVSLRALALRAPHHAAKRTSLHTERCVVVRRRGALTAARRRARARS